MGRDSLCLKNKYEEMKNMPFSMQETAYFSYIHFFIPFH